MESPFPLPARWLRLPVLLASAAILGLPARSRAEEWIILGARSMGMGGAGVASTRGGLGMYWNPAALGLLPPRPEPEATTEKENGRRHDNQDKEEKEPEEAPHPFLDLQFPASMNLAATGGILPTISEIAGLVEELDFPAIEGKLQSGSLLTPAETQTALRLLTVELPKLDAPGTGLLLDGGVGATARIWRFGLSALGLGYAGGRPIIDNVNLALGNQGIDPLIGPGQDRSGSISPASQNLADQIAAAGLATQNQAEEIVFQAEQGGVNTASPAFQTSLLDILAATAASNGAPDLSTSFTNNQSGTEIRGLIMKEFGVGFGLPIGDWLAVGAAAKLIQATSYFRAIRLSDVEDADALVKDLLDFKNEEESVNFSIDAGVLLRPADWLVLGVTGKHLNRPRFDFGGAGDLELDPQARAGIALQPFDWLTLAADIDLFVNHSDVLPGFESQLIGGGAELNLLDLIFVRGGLSKNLRDDDEDILLHGGLGLKVWYFSLDAAVMITPSFQDLNTDSGIKDLPERSGFSLLLGFNIPL